MRHCSVAGHIEASCAAPKQRTRGAFKRPRTSAALLLWIDRMGIPEMKAYARRVNIRFALGAIDETERRERLAAIWNQSRLICRENRATRGG